MQQSYIEFRGFEILNEDEKRKFGFLNILKQATDQLQNFTEKLIRLYQIKYQNYDEYMLENGIEPGLLEYKKLSDVQLFFSTIKHTSSRKVLGELCKKEISNLEMLIENRLTFIEDLTRLRKDNPTINHVPYEDEDYKYELLKVVQ